MNRSELINYFTYQRNSRRYLEISMDDVQHTLTQVRCAHKVTTFPFSSEEFFAQNHEEFDLIFIDGIHTEKQVLEDIGYAFRRLSEGGVIILHDCMPPDAWSQREPEAYQEGENWNGTVWKAALRVFNTSGFRCTLLDMDWGCGIIDTSQTQVARCRQLPDKLEYAWHYPGLLEYKTSILDYLRAAVEVFYHLACMGNWQQVFAEQMQQLNLNGFRKINLSILGQEDDLPTVQAVIGGLGCSADIIFHAPDFTHYEKPALLAIEAYAKAHDGYVLYLHSKGVSSPANDTKAKWRRLMMLELVQHSERCLLQLPHYEIIGVNWRECPPISHFCGNFWYAATRYLRTLADFTNYYENPRHQIWDAFNFRRLGCEFWISSAQVSPRVLSLACRDVDFCNPDYWINR